LLGHPLALELLVDNRPVGYLETAGGTGVGTGIQQPGQLVVIQLSPSASALASSFWMAPTLSLVLALIWRIDSPAACRKRRTSRIFRIVVLLVGMTAPKKRKSIPNGLKNNALGKIPV
jgi:hypothetical protein